MEEKIYPLSSVHHGRFALHKLRRSVAACRGSKCIGKTAGCLSERDAADGISKSSAELLSDGSDYRHSLRRGPAARRVSEGEECKEVSSE